MNSIDKEYQRLLEYILENGVEKKDRTGTGTLSIFGWQIRHRMSEGFPLLTTKKMYWKGIVTELLWFLRGDTNIRYLVDNDCHIWDGDAYKAFHSRFPETEMMSKQDFIETVRVNDDFAKKWGELGPIYGKQWRDLGGYTETKLTNERTKEGWLKYEYTHHKGIDQIQNLINELKTNPDSRRLMVSAWNVGELKKMVLPPCHYGFQVWTKEEKISGQRYISLMWNQRSVDTLLGLPFNIASYALLLTMIADEVNMIPDELIGNLGDCHLYLNHVEQAKEQISRTPYDLPIVKVQDGIHCSYPSDVILENYQSHPTIKASLSN